MGNYPSYWRERNADEKLVEAITKKGYSPRVARLLASRGVEVDDLGEYFDSNLSRLVSPESLPGITEAVAVILPFIHQKRPIVVFGDYDVDGVCAVAILVTAIRRLGGVVDAFIPHRLNEGYGMTANSLERLKREFPNAELVVTVDNGITSACEIKQLKARGLTVVVTDHHLPPDNGMLPEADALVDPRVKSAPGCENLCGAGVAFFLVSALTKAVIAKGWYKGKKFAGPLLVLAGLATVADLVPVVRQNRVLVLNSLANFLRYAPIGLQELLNRAQRSAADLKSRDYAFALGPRINAAGRMDNALFAYNLIMCDEKARENARELARKVDELNVDRKTIEQQMAEAAEKQIGKPCDLKVAGVIARGDGTWNLGVAGIVAARLVEEYHVPAAVMVGDTGSVRAPDGYNVHNALEAAHDYLLRFGGHAAAGGFTVKSGAFEKFCVAFQKACAEQRDSAPEASVYLFDGWLEPNELTVELCDQVSRLEPFGEGNEEPVFGLKNVAFSEIRMMGLDGRHASFTFVNRNMPRAVWWSHGIEVEFLRAHSANRYDVLFTLSTTEYGGGPRRVELRIVDLRVTI